MQAKYSQQFVLDGAPESKQFYPEIKVHRFLENLTNAHNNTHEIVSIC
jgi:hypothetical protein